ncbi:MAG: hypothetical protein ACXV3C_08990 [Actinomycetes bacterium]
MRRRDFLGQLVSASVGTALLSTHSGRPGTDAAASATAADLAAVPDPPPGLTRTWLGPMLWANRLQDFRASNGRYECVATGRMRTVSLITYSLLPGAGTASLSMLTGTLANGAGFSGFLVGAGSGRLDYRAASLVQAASGTGGGLLCTYENDGRCRFRGHTSESSQLSYPVLAVAATGPSPARSLTESVRLTLDLAPSPTGPAGSFRLTLTARRSSDALLLSQATLDRVADTALTGGVLVASGPIGSTSSRCWFSTVTASSTKVGSFPERAMGPVLGTLFSLNGSVLKMTAQLFPVGASEPQGVTLRYRTPGSATWSTGPTATVGDGYTAQLRVGTWDVTRPWEYQVVYGLGTAQESVYGGTVPAAPGTLGQLTVGVVNCTIHSYRPLDEASPFTPKLPGETAQALYTPLNLYFPYAEVVTRLAGHGIDLLAALGDQFYENRPTQTDKARRPPSTSSTSTTCGCGPSGTSRATSRASSSSTTTTCTRATSGATKGPGRPVATAPAGTSRRPRGSTRSSVCRRGTTPTRTTPPRCSRASRCRTARSPTAA